MTKSFLFSDFLKDDTEFKVGIEFEKDDEALLLAIEKYSPIHNAIGWLFLSVNGISVFDFEGETDPRTRYGYYHVPLLHVANMCYSLPTYLEEDLVCDVVPLIRVVREDPASMNLSGEDHYRLVMDHVISGHQETVYPLVAFCRRSEAVEISWYPSHEGVAPWFGAADSDGESNGQVSSHPHEPSESPVSATISFHTFSEGFRTCMKRIGAGLQDIYRGASSEIDDLCARIDLLE